MPPSAIPADVAQKESPRGLELLTYETESEHPAPESVFFIIPLLGYRACVLEVFCKLAHGEAKLNVGFELSAMNPAFFAAVRLIELEEAKLDSAFRECGVKVEHVVTAFVVVMISEVNCVIAFVPDVSELGHGLGLDDVELVQKIGVNRPAVLRCSARCDVDCASDLLFVSGHDVCEVGEGFGGVVSKSDVNVNSATP